jgi:ABC-type transporter Mla MlaB component
MQVKYKAMIFHLQQMTIRRRIIKLHTNTADICISINNQNSKIMSVQITYDGGVYEIKGLLNAQNGESLKNHFEVLMNHSKGIVISLNKVLHIDSGSVNIISDLHRKAQVSDTLFYIIGRENQKVKELFTTLNYYDILL